VITDPCQSTQVFEGTSLSNEFFDISIYNERQKQYNKTSQNNLSQKLPKKNVLNIKDAILPPGPAIAGSINKITINNAKVPTNSNLKNLHIILVPF